MAESPQPPTLHEGASTPPAPTSTTTSTTKPGAEAAKEAAALSSLEDTNTIGQSSSGSNGADTEALGKAMRDLDVKGGVAGVSQQQKQQVKKAPVVKVDVGDMGVVVEQLELSRPRATELLKAHGGNLREALAAFVTARG